ncbi:MAG: DUF445 domain-containing protein [Weeksellaceae bacterium]|nr:DUF445 domain-containing protein [Weeksellaceae bacterium]
MRQIEKQKELNRYKWFATGLFILMAVVFVVTTYMQRSNDAHWIGLIRAFAEAGMVGALADWFAVTALFHHPLGLRIPHTNLIEKSQQKIGNNLGDFVVGNFLSPENLKPYFKNLRIASRAGQWLSQAHNQQRLIDEVSHILLDILHKAEEEKVLRFALGKAQNMLTEMQLSKPAAGAVEYLVEQQAHHKIITYLATEIGGFLRNNKSMVRERVRKESSPFLPAFADNMIADRIHKGMMGYFAEIEHNMQHPLREEIAEKLLQIGRAMEEDGYLEDDLQNIMQQLLDYEKVEPYVGEIWDNVKQGLVWELTHAESSLQSYLRRSIAEWAQKLQQDVALQAKADGWIRVQAYRQIMRNRHKFGELISNTVGDWEGRELSNKLELEVGKDLQFIRVNGTLVGGLVGLILYVIVHFVLV